MEYILACNWDKELLLGVRGKNVKSVFGGIPNSIIPGGRASINISNVNQEDVEEYVKECHAAGLEFNYLINGTCMDNLEFTKQGYHDILKHLEWLAKIEVDSVTITLPFIIELVVKHFPHIKVEVSSFQKIDTVARAKRFEDMGVHSLMLLEHINRDFKVLKAIRQSVDCEIILLGNVGCIYGCASYFSHSNFQAHGSQANHCTEGFAADGYMMDCTYKKIMNPMEFIRGRWIRPDDVHHYEEIGIDTIKILERRCTTRALLERLDYYNQQKYSGNLINILGQMPNEKEYLAPNPLYLMNEKYANVIRVLKTLSVVEKAPLSDAIYVDNDKIPRDFLDYFKKVDCRALSCDHCRYCHKIADQVISFNEELIEKTREKFKKIKSGLIMGDVFV
ncbi:MAG: U32 family peptidase [Thermodesulfobacteriota bacterium]|nr:U32 family peptidase [Thermodesulfobacteriota bacterium]